MMILLLNACIVSIDVLCLQDNMWIRLLRHFIQRTKNVGEYISEHVRTECRGDSSERNNYLSQ